jgi:hypothetical protein
LDGIARKASWTKPLYDVAMGIALNGLALEIYFDLIYCWWFDKKLADTLINLHKRNELLSVFVRISGKNA